MTVVAERSRCCLVCDDLGATAGAGVHDGVTVFWSLIHVPLSQPQILLLLVQDHAGLLPAFWPSQAPASLSRPVLPVKLGKAVFTFIFLLFCIKRKPTAAVGAFIGYHSHTQASPLGLPHSLQNLPLLTVPQFGQVHSTEGLGFPHSLQNFPVFSTWQAGQIHG